jgi:hypothetical protein
LPQELRLAGITELEEAKRFLGERYIAVFNEKFKVAAMEKGTAFRRTARSDLDWIFTVQTERVLNKDNTVAIADRMWQLEKSRFRSSLAGCTVTIHEHLNGTISIRYGPHVVGRYTADGNPLGAVPKARPSPGKGGLVEVMENHKPVSHRSPRPLEIPQNRRHSHFPTASTTTTFAKRKTRNPPRLAEGGRQGKSVETGQITCE